MTTRELWITLNNGRTYLAARERDDAVGRRALDHQAFAATTDPKVAEVRITRPLARHASSAKGASR